MTRDGQLGEFYLVMYLHALGPALQWVDASFIHRGFKRPAGAAVALVAVIAAYVGWAEFVVQPLNSTPVGSVTTGLPYPFLNDLELAGRMTFYGANAAVSLVFLAGFCALVWVVRRVTAMP